MSDENKKTGIDGDSAEKVKKSAVKKKIKAEKNEQPEAEGKKNKVIEKLQAMGVMSGGTPKSTEKVESRKDEFIKVAAASAVAILVVGSFVWALDKEASNERALSKTNNTSHSDPYAMHSRSSSQWGPSSMNQYNGRTTAFNEASREDNQKNYEKHEERMKKHREQQQKAFEQQQAQRQKWIEQQNKANTHYQQQQQKWMIQQQKQQQPYTQNYGAQIPENQQQWIEQQNNANSDYQAQQQKWYEQQRAQQQFQPQNMMQQTNSAQQQWIEQQRAQQQRMQEQQREQQQKWNEQAYNSYPPQNNRQAQPFPPAYRNHMGYQQPTPYNYYGR